MWAIWAAAHRGIFFALATYLVWGAAILWFFRLDFRRMTRNKRPRNWSANMETRTGVGGLDKAKH